jgi:hypothetical protein
MKTLPPKLAHERAILARFASTYGFKAVEASDLVQQGPGVDQALRACAVQMEALASILARAGGLEPAHARALCGLRGSTTLKLAMPGEIAPGAGASFSPAARAISVLCVATESGPAASHFGHEWAHSLDAFVGAPLGAQGSLAEPSAALADIAKAAAGLLPFQATLGALARGVALARRQEAPYASAAIASGFKGAAALESRLPEFSAVVRASLPVAAHALPRSRKAFLSKALVGQAERLEAFAEEAAFESLSGHPLVARTGAPARTVKALARFCAQAVVRRSGREGARRRGREASMDGAKADIALFLGRSLNLSAQEAGSLASDIFHIEPIKRAFADPFYSAPYTGRGSWAVPGSLADLGCALVRLSRNQRALKNSGLSKERFVPMALWWSSRRQATEHATLLEAKAPSVLSRLALMGMAPADSPERARLWGERMGPYKAGAAVFSDLVATGAKLIRREAEFNGGSINDQQARSIRRSISAPINELASATAVYEMFAESFEQFVVAQARSKTSLGQACQSALACGLVDPDPEERAAALDPSLSWMHNKDADVGGNLRRWRALLRELPTIAQPKARAPRT